MGHTRSMPRSHKHLHGNTGQNNLQTPPPTLPRLSKSIPNNRLHPNHPRNNNNILHTKMDKKQLQKNRKRTQKNQRKPRNRRTQKNTQRIHRTLRKPTTKRRNILRQHSNNNIHLRLDSSPQPTQTIQRLRRIPITNNRNSLPSHNRSPNNIRPILEKQSPKTKHNIGEWGNCFPIQNKHTHKSFYFQRIASISHGENG